MNEADARRLIQASYERFERMVLSLSGVTGVGPQTEQLILRTLRQVQHDLEADPTCVEDIIRAAMPATRRPSV